MESAVRTADAGQQTTQIRRTGANHLPLQFPPPCDLPSTTRCRARLEAHCAAGGKTSPCVRPSVVPENRIPDALAPARNRSHRLRGLADDKFLHNATTFRNPDVRSMASY